MDIIDRRSFGRHLKLHDADCIDRKKAPLCQRCKINPSTVGTINKEKGVAENLCGGCIDDELTVIVNYI